MSLCNKIVIPLKILLWTELLVVEPYPHACERKQYRDKVFATSDIVCLLLD